VVVWEKPHVPSADAALSTAEATSFPSSHPIHPKTPEGGAVKPTDRDPYSTTLEAPPASIDTLKKALPSLI